MLLKSELGVNEVATMSTRKPRPKKERGRPLKKLYPPRVDATPEDMAQAMFSLPAGRKWEYHESWAGGDGVPLRGL